MSPCASRVHICSFSLGDAILVEVMHLVEGLGEPLASAGALTATSL